MTARDIFHSVQTMNKVAFISTLALLSTGCASTYTPPTSGPTATVHLQANFVILNKQGTEGSCTSYESIRKEEIDGKFTVPAGKPLWVGHSFVAGPTTNCRIGYTFTPEAGVQYVIRADKSAFRCTASLQRLTPSGRWESEPSLEVKRWPALCLLPG